MSATTRSSRCSAVSRSRSSSSASTWVRREQSLRKLSRQVAGKVTVGDLDPAILGLNEGIKQGRVKLAAAQEAADEQWVEFDDELAGALDELRDDLAEEGA